MARRVITVQRDLAGAARLLADPFRAEMAAAGTFVVNVLSSPGAGKTTLLAETARRWGDRVRCGVLVGDIATDRDAQRLAPYVPVIQLTTGGACHLSPALVQRGWEQWEAGTPEFLFIENVGNLVCPSSHDLGEHLRVCLLSTTEGDDKPAKYPKAFRTSQAMVVSKTDLLPYLPFDLEAVSRDARAVQPALDVLPLSALTGEGVDAWCEFLIGRRNAFLHEYGVDGGR